MNCGGAFCFALFRPTLGALCGNFSSPLAIASLASNDAPVMSSGAIKAARSPVKLPLKK
jgi:hypothetical protein